MKEVKSLLTIIIGVLTLVSLGCNDAEKDKKIYESYTLEAILEARNVIEEELKKTVRKCKNKDGSFVLIDHKLTEFGNLGWNIASIERTYLDAKNDIAFKAAISIVPSKDVRAEQNQKVPIRVFDRESLKWPDFQAFDFTKAPTISVKKEKGKWSFESLYSAPKSSCEALTREKPKPLIEDLYSPTELEAKRHQEEEKNRIEGLPRFVKAYREAKFTKCEGRYYTEKLFESSEAAKGKVSFYSYKDLSVRLPKPKKNEEGAETTDDDNQAEQDESQEQDVTETKIQVEELSKAGKIMRATRSDAAFSQVEEKWENPVLAEIEIEFKNGRWKVKDGQDIFEAVSCDVIQHLYEAQRREEEKRGQQAEIERQRQKEQIESEAKGQLGKYFIRCDGAVYALTRVPQDRRTDVFSLLQILSDSFNPVVEYRKSQRGFDECLLWMKPSALWVHSYTNTPSRVNTYRYNNVTMKFVMKKLSFGNWGINSLVSTNSDHWLETIVTLESNLSCDMVSTILPLTGR